MFKFIFTIILSFSISFANSNILDQMRANELSKFSDNTFLIFSYSNKYILSTGDLFLTKSKIANKYQLDEQIFFSNFDNSNTINMEIDVNKKELQLSNLLGVLPNKFVVQSFLSSSSGNKLNYADNNYSSFYSFDSLTSNFISFLSKINSNPNIVISENEPLETSKTWYQPLGNGTFKVFSYLNSIWNLAGTSSFESTSIQANSLSLLNTISCSFNDKGFVTSALKAESYFCDKNNQWVKLNSGSIDAFNGNATILELATSLINYPEGSIAKVSDFFSSGVKHSFNGYKSFNKVSSKNSNGYWLDESELFLVGSSINDVSSRNWINGTIAYIPNQINTEIIPLERINGEWFIIANGYNDVVQQDITSLKVLDKKNNQYFKFVNNYWVDITYSGNSIESTFLTKHSSGRDVFPSPKVNSKYLTLDNDCLELTCNAPITQNYFGGEQIDSMFVYYYSSSSFAKLKNNLIDAIPISSITEIYNRDIYAGLINNKIYIKDKDTLNRVCYKNISNNNYYTKGGIVISTGNNLPSSRTCETATYSGDSLILDTRTEATEWITAPNNTKVYLTVNSTIYTHLVGSGKDFWTTDATGDGQINATEIFTRGDRTKFPMVTKNIVALSKLVDLPNYSTIGIVSTIDTSFKKWNYDNLDPIRVNNLVDKLLPPFPTGTLKCVGKPKKSIIEYDGGIKVYVAEGVADIQTEIFGINKRNPLHICTSNVTSMANLFNGNTTPYKLEKKDFNLDISNWDTSNVTTMSSMFSNATLFNQPLNSWNVSKVTTMNGMFYYATNFNQPIGSWNVSKVTSMSQMFYDATNFNQPIGSWNVSNVIYMSQMFNKATNFNQDISLWNVSKVTYMNEMFYFATNFNQPIGSWNTSNVTNMSNMFGYVRNFNQNLSKWCVSKILSIPNGFDTLTTAWVKTGRQPIWGTCPL